jgi:hypothetical protein
MSNKAAILLFAIHLNIYPVDIGYNRKDHQHQGTFLAGGIGVGICCRVQAREI